VGEAVSRSAVWKCRMARVLPVEFKEIPWRVPVSVVHPAIFWQWSAYHCENVIEDHVRR
jgi:hypothetical protein